MRTQRRYTTARAFALPTVLIASVVLITILAVSVTATTAVRNALKSQYYVQLAQVAGESGVAMAKACLSQSGNVPTWTNAKPLTPATDCSGNVVLGPAVKALVVAGGGSGGGSTGGGGGAGGVIYNPSVDIDEESFSVTVGGGGAASGNQAHGKNGANSSFNGLTAIGGGGGGNTSGDSSADSGGSNGGSGGGGQNYHAAYTSGNGTTGQGNAGGPLGTIAGSGGGGAGGPGLAGSGSNAGGDGGPGVQYAISGAMVYYGAGGGGAGNGSAGNGGAGDSSTTGQNSVGSPGRPNSGDGGGAGWNYTGGNSGAGGSGVVIISYPDSSGIDADGGTKVDNGTNTIHKFTSSGTFTVNSQGSTTCPSDPRCSVTVSDDGTTRSSFTVPKPVVDANGRALTILNNGYTEILRKSNGSVWRTYRQPSVQNAVVPDLCSGSATSARGWNAAAVSSQQDTLSTTNTAQSIGLAAGAVNAGPIFFRKDFNVSRAGTYDFNLFTGSSQDTATAYLDGQQVNATNGGQSIVQTSLVPGCHALVVKLINQTYLPRISDFTASITTTASATPLVVTDNTWRVSTGDTYQFSMNNYYETSAWEPGLVIGKWNDTTLPWAGAPSDWGASSKDTLTNWISTKYSSGSPASRPAPAYAWFRTPIFTLGSNANVLVSSVCDNDCVVYLDGNRIFIADLAQGTVNKTINIGAGSHTFGVRLYNDGSSANSSAFLFAAANTSASNAIIVRSDGSWDGTTSWSSVSGDPYSYDAIFTPVPYL